MNKQIVPNTGEGGGLAGPGIFQLQFVGGPLVVGANSKIDLSFNVTRFSNAVGCFGTYQLTRNGLPVGNPVAAPDTAAAFSNVAGVASFQAQPGDVLGIQVTVGAGCIEGIQGGTLSAISTRTPGQCGQPAFISFMGE